MSEDDFKLIRHGDTEYRIIKDWQIQKVLQWKAVIDRMAVTVNKSQVCGCDECKLLIKRIEAFLWGTDDPHDYK